VSKAEGRIIQMPIINACKVSPTWHISKWDIVISTSK